MSHPFRCPFSASARIGRTLFIPLVGIGLLAYSNFTFAAAPGCPPEASDELVEPTEEDEMLDEEEELEDIELLDLEVPMVVTASRHAQKITSVPHAMSVVTAEDIRQSGARSIPDALRLVPGVDVADLDRKSVV